MAKETKQQAAVNVANELLARIGELDAIGEYDLGIFDSVLTIALGGKVCYTGLVAQVIGILKQLEDRHEACGANSWVYWQDAKIEKRARDLKAKAIKLTIRFDGDLAA